MVHKWYKYTINKRIIKQSNNKLDKKKNRYNIVYYSGFMIDDISLLMISYLPMQKVLYFNNLFYINDLYMHMCLSRDKLGTKIGVKNAKKNKYRH